MESSEDYQHRKCTRNTKEKNLLQVKKSCKDKPRCDDSSNGNSSKTDSNMDLIWALNDMLTKVVDYTTYRLRNRVSAYNSQIALEINKQYKRLGFRTGGINFTDFVEIACGYDCFSEIAAMSLF